MLKAFKFTERPAPDETSRRSLCTDGKVVVADFLEPIPGAALLILRGMLLHAIHHFNHTSNATEFKLVWQSDAVLLLDIFSRNSWA